MTASISIAVRGAGLYFAGVFSVMSGSDCDSRGLPFRDSCCCDDDDDDDRRPAANACDPGVAETACAVKVCPAVFFFLAHVVLLDGWLPPDLARA